MKDKKFLSAFFIIGLTCFLAVSGMVSLVAASDTTENVENLTIITADGREFLFTVEIATTVEERKKGLMFRRFLAPQSGMLFDYGEMRKAAMWMKNTYVPLDILFIDDTGVIVNIAHNTVPLSLIPISSDGPVLCVLEINAGTAKSLNIKAGDVVSNRIIKETVE